MKLNAVFTGDSPNYHIFQVVGNGACVGSIYIKKKDVEIPKALGLSLITPSSDKKAWKQGMNDLLDITREGSKAESKLIKTLKSYE
jgi:hypothetical protein